MTAIVGLIQDGTVYLGGDSCGTHGNSVWINARPKVWRMAGCVVGVSGSPVVQDVLEHSMWWPAMYDDGADTVRWVCCSFVPALREALRSAGQLGRCTSGDPQGMDEMNANVMLGIGGQATGRLFEICATFQVLEVVEKYTAGGSGASVALGALYATELRQMLPAQRITIALEAAARFDSTVRAPFHVVSTE